MRFIVEHELPPRRVLDLLHTFLDGVPGSGWVRRVRFYRWSESNTKTQVSYDEWAAEDGSFFAGKWSVEIETDEGETRTLGWRKLKWALERRDMRRHFAEFMAENEDVETADALVQMAIFKEIVYG